jgi:muramoyltetrapeptide carboxypeptidase
MGMAKALKPAVLRKGDTIGLFAPAGPLPAPEIILEGCEIINRFGLKIKYAADINARNDYLAGPDARRIAEFKNLWHDKEVKALLAVRGGYGSIRVLSELDMEEISNNPKILIGFSDITVLLNGLQAKTSLVTFHGPMISTLVRDHKVMPCELLEFLTRPTLDDLRPRNLRILRSGQAAGRLMGGNLTNLVHLLGTPFEPDWHRTILLLEDINEPAYKIDRMLTQLKLAGRLDKVSGIILGGFLSGSNEEIQEMHLVTRRILELTESHVPIWTNFPISHGPDNTVLPIGIEALMDSEQQRLHFTEACFQV